MRPRRTPSSTPGAGAARSSCSSGAGRELAGGFVLGADEGPASWWWAGALNLTELTGATTGGGVDLVDHRVPAGCASPLHVHADQDEVFAVLDEAFSLRCGSQRLEAGAGAVVFLPRGVPHAFRTSEEGTGRAWC